MVTTNTRNETMNATLSNPSLEGTNGLQAMNARKKTTIYFRVMKEQQEPTATSYQGATLYVYESDDGEMPRIYSTALFNADYQRGGAGNDGEAILYWYGERFSVRGWDSARSLQKTAKLVAKMERQSYRLRSKGFTWDGDNRDELWVRIRELRSLGAVQLSVENGEFVRGVQE